MNEGIQNYIALGEVDSQLFDLNMKLRRMPTRIAEAKKMLETDKKQLDELQLPWDQLDKEIKEREAGSKIALDTIEKFETHMAQVTTQKEYIAARKQVDEARRLNTQLEDEILERRVKQDEMKSELEERQERYSKVLETYKGEEGEILKEQKGLESEVSKHEKTVAGLLEKLGGELTNHYTRLNKGGKRPCVVPVTGGSCAGCRMALPPQSYNMLIANNGTLFPCPSCSRALYFPPPEESKDEPDTNSKAAEKVKPKKATKKKAASKAAPKEPAPEPPVEATANASGDEETGGEAASVAAS